MKEENKKFLDSLFDSLINGQLGNEMRIVSQNTTDHYIFTDVNQVEGLETIYLDITDIDAIRKMVKENDVKAIVNCAAWTNVVQDDAQLDSNQATVEGCLRPVWYSYIRTRFG